MMHGRWMVLGVALAIAGCGDDDSGNTPRADAAVDAAVGSQMIGAAGGTISLPDGPTLTVPAGALAMDVLITITATSLDAPGKVTPIYEFSPPGLTFAVPATVSFPVTDAMDALAVYWSQAGSTSTYDELPSTQTTTAVSAEIVHFSNGYVAPVTPPTAVGTDNTFVLSEVRVPATNTQAREYGLDLNQDQTVDNQLGMVFSTLGSFGLDPAAATTEAVDRGTILVLANLITTSFTNAQAAGFRTYLGATPSPAPCMNAGDNTCRKHLAGTGTFTVDAANPTNAPLVGNFVSGTLTTPGPGHAVLQVAVTPDRAMTLNLIGARVKITSASASGITTGVLAGALTEAELDTTFIPEFTLSANEAVMADCTSLSSPPGCGCAGESSGKTYIDLFDTTANCTITETEIRNNSLIMALLAPDVVVEGQQAISIGVGFTAVAGTFTP